jgi:predicted ribosome quality control (RQC) complex YloA/Tae2 family protein
LTLRPVEIADVAREIGRALAGRVVQKVVQPDEATVLLGLRGGWLLVSADARAGRLHLIEGKPPGTGEAAPAFCMLLRKELIGLALTEVAAVPGERAAELRFAREGESRRLRLFLFGPSAQLQLVGDEERILAAIGPGKKLQAALPPPRAAGAPPSRFPVEQPSLEIARTYGERTSAEVRSQAMAEVRAALKKHERLVAALGRDRDKALAATEKKKLADLLLAHLHEIPRGASSVQLPDDFADGAPIVIALDPALSARDNAARFYKEHKRLSRALASIDARISTAQAALGDAAARLERLAHASDEELAHVAASRPAPPRGAAAPKRGRPDRPPPYREYRAATGATILVGRGADRNDELTFKVARGNDLWLHTRDVPGAHVIVPLAAGRAVDAETLLDAATLAAHHSNARGQEQVDVTYVLRKHVRKPPRARPGTVTLSGGKTLRVRLEPARLERLLAARVDPID